MNNYVKGRRVEYYIKDTLQKMGAEVVIRSAGSRTPFDLIAIFPRRQEIWLIQVKKDLRYLRRIELQKLRYWALVLNNMYQLTVMVAGKEKGKYVFKGVL